MTTLPDGQAFPRAGFYDAANEACDNGDNGLTVREHFAALAMQGILADPNVTVGTRDGNAQVARWAVQLADALIEALNAKE